MQINGRGQLTVLANAYRGETVIRIDNDSRPSFWAEVILTVDDLEQLLCKARLSMEPVKRTPIDPNDVVWAM